MKNIPFPTYLLLCFLMLMINTPSQAITATTVAVSKEQKKVPKKEAKIERLKKKLSKKMAKLNPKQTESEWIKKRAKLTKIMGSLSFVFLLSVFFLLPFIGLSVPFAITSLLYSKRTLKAIQKSASPERYEEEKKKVKTGREYGFLTLSILLVVLGLLIGFAGTFQV